MGILKIIKKSIVELPKAIGGISDTLNITDKIKNAPSINLVEKIAVVPVGSVVAVEDEEAENLDEGWEEVNNPFLPSVATTTTDGLMSANDKAKLDALDMSGVITITKSVLMSTANTWYDTGITGEYLDSGTYIVDMLCNFDGQAGQWGERYSGVMSWYYGHTNGDGVSHITLHNTGHSDENAKIQLRTIHRFNTNHGISLQILATRGMGAAKDAVFKFRRII